MLLFCPYKSRYSNTLYAFGDFGDNIALVSVNTQNGASQPLYTFDGASFDLVSAGLDSGSAMYYYLYNNATQLSYFDVNTPTKLQTAKVSCPYYVTKIFFSFSSSTFIGLGMTYESGVNYYFLEFTQSQSHFTCQATLINLKMERPVIQSSTYDQYNSLYFSTIDGDTQIRYLFQYNIQTGELDLIPINPNVVILSLRGLW
eukprot:TRINITY_DN2449_c0_g1_i3.p1 TRINITY_DN2449_c0_g1~~TRINITY_DN2449_c0_g1_i3.p1  ORF type:complete len:201 (-),score=30.95 TRINITY_DN2449_c0_g1_i3:103-705(-)